MAACSPWFFTHYGRDTYNKNWIFNLDDWLFAARWEQLVKNKAEVNLVQLLSWNDYGESHYLGPIFVGDMDCWFRSSSLAETRVLVCQRFQNRILFRLR
ncbi:uncharacterized protein BT62DRAFT_486574 [Guyanagaster necrorhizus]|uniref:Uncharacterized protein n=1 Tax=Guyanagaster necrorhizus TaxID=856835 RepID=A0A9P7VHZ7_9AGAR|nr:uncharacterized protein BT62DRAFT_486574 [Guyanagaster necrorhizus MCA 3950]KAG7441403.1 hypothetical protein BT62DRAFT_486574 [Guyanagaster necrorhizus MCA 3950]